MDERELRCCFTGHRPNKLPWGTRENDARCYRLKFQLAARLEELFQAGYRRFLCGMAMGCDLYFAEAVLELRRLHPEVRLEAAVPCRDQADKWPEEQRQRYRRLLDECDSVEVLQEHYSPDCMLRRNRCMVDRSTLLLACFDGQPGGTMSTVLYAKRQGLKLVIIDL